MRILYGIAGDGLGHAVRSSVIIEELLRHGHEVRVVVSGDARPYVEEKFSAVTEIWGLSVVTRGNSVSQGLTIATNIRQGLAPSGLPRNLYKCFELARQFDPDVVISDHEMWSWFFGALRDTPVVGLDNIHQVSRCSHPDPVLDGIETEYPLAKIVVQARVPTAAHYLVSTFAWPEVRKRNTTLVPPILRDMILEAEPTDGDHLLVYETSYAKSDLASLLRHLDCPVHVYGACSEEEGEHQVDNITFRPFDESQFVADLAACRGVVGSAGFTLITEALHLGKPYLAVPVEGQVEQMMNARYLEWLGYGAYSMEPNLETVRTFLSELPRYRGKLEEYERHDNTPTFEKLHTLLRRESRRGSATPAARLRSRTNDEVVAN